MVKEKLCAEVRRASDRVMAVVSSFEEICRG